MAHKLAGPWQQSLGVGKLRAVKEPDVDVPRRTPPLLPPLLHMLREAEQVLHLKLRAVVQHQRP